MTIANVQKEIISYKSSNYYYSLVANTNSVNIITKSPDGKNLEYINAQDLGLETISSICINENNTIVISGTKIINFLGVDRITNGILVSNNDLTDTIFHNLELLDISQITSLGMNVFLVGTTELVLSNDLSTLTRRLRFDFINLNTINEKCMDSGHNGVYYTTDGLLFKQNQENSSIFFNYISTYNYNDSYDKWMKVIDDGIYYNSGNTLIEIKNDNYSLINIDSPLYYYSSLGSNDLMFVSSIYGDLFYYKKENDIFVKYNMIGLSPSFYNTIVNNSDKYLTTNETDLFESYDGINFSKVTLNINAQNIIDLHVVNNYFVMTFFDSSRKFNTAWSEDGITWTVSAIDTDLFVNVVNRQNGIYKTPSGYALWFPGYLLESIDCKTWTLTSNFLNLFNNSFATFNKIYFNYEKNCHELILKIANTNYDQRLFNLINGEWDLISQKLLISKFYFDRFSAADNTFIKNQNNIISYNTNGITLIDYSIETMLPKINVCTKVDNTYFIGTYQSSGAIGYLTSNDRNVWTEGTLNIIIPNVNDMINIIIQKIKQKWILSITYNIQNEYYNCLYISNDFVNWSPISIISDDSDAIYWEQKTDNIELMIRDYEFFINDNITFIPNDNNPLLSTTFNYNSWQYVEPDFPSTPLYYFKTQSGLFASIYDVDRDINLIYKNINGYDWVESLSGFNNEIYNVIDGNPLSLIDNGDGTYSIEYFENGTSSIKSLPDNSNGYYYNVFKFNNKFITFYLESDQLIKYYESDDMSIWEESIIDIPANNVDSIKIQNGNIRIQDGFDNNLYISKNGRDWANVPININGTLMDSIIINDSSIFVIISDETPDVYNNVYYSIYHSNDLGINWLELPDIKYGVKADNNNYDTLIMMNYNNKNEIIAITYPLVYDTNDILNYSSNIFKIDENLNIDKVIDSTKIPAYSIDCKPKNDMQSIKNVFVRNIDNQIVFVYSRYYQEA